MRRVVRLAAFIVMAFATDHLGWTARLIMIAMVLVVMITAYLDGLEDTR